MAGVDGQVAGIDKCVVGVNECMVGVDEHVVTVPNLWFLNPNPRFLNPLRVIVILYSDLCGHSTMFTHNHVRYGFSGHRYGVENADLRVTHDEPYLPQL